MCARRTGWSVLAGSTTFWKPTLRCDMCARAHPTNTCLCRERGEDLRCCDQGGEVVLRPVAVGVISSPGKPDQGRWKPVVNSLSYCMVHDFVKTRLLENRK